MFISVLDLFKIGIGPSSSHTLGPMIAAREFMQSIQNSHFNDLNNTSITCTLKGSLAFTGKGHATDKAIILGLHGYTAEQLLETPVDPLIHTLSNQTRIALSANTHLHFQPSQHLIFDTHHTLTEHPNGMVFELKNAQQNTIFSETYFSIGGGFICTQAEIAQLQAPLKPIQSKLTCPYPFDSATSMLEMANKHSLSIAQMKRENERCYQSDARLIDGIEKIWNAMQACIKKGLNSDGILPGGLNVPRRAKRLFHALNQHPSQANINDWLCAYAMAANEENAAGHMVVTAPTNGAAGVIPAVLYYFVQHEQATDTQIQNFFLTAAAIGGLIKHLSSISGAEVGCQGEVGSASAMAAAGLCAAKGGTAEQIENAAEIALEHHLGMTCDPVKGLVQIPCIERNGFGAIKAYTAASLALRGNGSHLMPLDHCIAAMKQTGLEMSHKFKETSLGGLAVSLTEC